MSNIKHRFGGGGTAIFDVITDGTVLRNGEPIERRELEKIAKGKLPWLCWAAAVHDQDGYQRYHEIKAARQAYAAQGEPSM